MVAESERNLEWRVEERDDEHQLWPWDQLQRWELSFVSLTSLYPSEVHRSLWGAASKYHEVDVCGTSGELWQAGRCAAQLPLADQGRKVVTWQSPAGS